MLPMKYLSVTELNQQIKFNIEELFFHCLVEGEISNVIKAQSGHIYFNLKDSGSVIRCVIWRSTAMMFSDFIENGAKVEVQGKLSLYVPRGDYQLVIARLAPLGRGNLYLAFEQLREKLQKEGLFDPEHKQPIASYPKKIGIVTSPNAAALQDVLRVLQDHRPDIPYVIYPTLVQGEEAAPQIVKALEQANHENVCDVLLVVRGGGSIEDLWCFNDERVVRAIYQSNIPVISGIGHETDTALSDFVADLRAPTPTAAAKLSSISKQELMQMLDHMALRLTQGVNLRLDHESKRLQTLKTRLSYLHPLKKIDEKKMMLNMQSQRLKTAILAIYGNKNHQLRYLKKQLNVDILRRSVNGLSTQLYGLSQSLNGQMHIMQIQYEKRLQQQVQLLDSLSPLKVLARGYSITQRLKDDENTTRINVDNLQVGNRLLTQLSDCEIVSTVDSVKHKKLDKKSRTN